MKYAFKKARSIRINDIVTGENLVTLNDLKSVKLTGSNDTVYAEGKDGEELAGFDVKKVSGFEAENGSVDTGLIALQTGSDETVVLNGNGVNIREEKVLTTATTFTLDHTATGTAGSEIKFIYKADRNGMPSEKFTQVDTIPAEAGTFQYTVGTNAITLFAGDFAIGDTVIVDYYPTFSKYNEIINKSDKFSKTGVVIVDAWFTDLFDQTDVPLQIVAPKGKLSGEYDYTFGDAAAVQNLKVNNMPQSKTHWKLYDYDMNDIVD